MYKMKERRSIVHEMRIWVIVLENTKDKTKFYHSCNYVPSRYIGCAYKYSTEKGAKIDWGM